MQCCIRSTKKDNIVRKVVEMVNNNFKLPSSYNIAADSIVKVPTASTNPHLQYIIQVHI